MSYEDGVEFTQWPWVFTDPLDPVEEFNLGYGFDSEGQPRAFLASCHMGCGVTLSAPELREMARHALEIAEKIERRQALAGRTSPDTSEKR